MSATLTEYMVQQANEFNLRCDLIEQRMTSIDEKVSSMEYNVNRLVNQLEVFLDTIPYNKSEVEGVNAYAKYFKKK
tara:strand:+ start:389 stop:616 length:228 start_codon:yes stop_codon:yes gene_type:complete